MPTRLARRVMLIGWDAADWQMIQPLLDAGQMPNLSRMAESGVMGKITTLHPILSPILWTSIATGKTGDKHQILGFVEPDGRGGIRPVASTSRKAKAIWNILSQAGLRSCVVGWYATHPAEKINGCIVSDRYQASVAASPRKTTLDDGMIHPASLARTLADLRVFPSDLTTRQLLPFLPEAMPVEAEKNPRIQALAKCLAECSTIHNATTYLAEHESWDFLAAYYDAIDHFGHGFMEFHPPKMPHVSEDDFVIFRNVMAGVYRFHDMMLGRLLDLAGDDTTVILMSDHGFQSSQLRPPLEADPTHPLRRRGPGVNPLAWHRTHGILLIKGPGIKQDELVHGATLLDITPTILAMLGLPIPQDMDGKPLVQIFTQPIEVSHIPSYEPPHEHDGIHREAQEEDPYTAQQALQQLIDLGYIQAPGADQAAAVQRVLDERLSNLAQIHFSAGRPDQAYALLRQLLKTQDTPAIRCRAAMCLVQMGRIDEAEPLLEGLSDQPGQMPLVSVLRGQIEFARGHYEAAFRLFDAAQAANPRLPYLHLYLGRVHLRMKRLSLAEQALRKALEIDDDNAEAHDELGVVLREQGKLEDALYEHMRSAALLHHRPQTHLHLGIVLARLRQFDWAIRAFTVASELAPTWPYPHRCLARIYRRAKNDLDSARKHMQIAWRLRREMTQSRQPF